MREIKKNVLGRTDFAVSEIGLGAWGVGSKGYGPVDKEQGVRTIEMYLEAGGNFIDTAPAYGGSEALLGEVIGSGPLRERVFLCTKTKMGDSLETVPKIKLACEGSLRLLKSEYIDVYYLHTPPEDPDTINRALDELANLKRDGKIRAVAASIKAAAVTSKTVDLCHTYIDTGKVDVIQVAYSFLRQANAEVFEKAYEKNVGIVTRSAIESGFLSGKYRPGHIFPDDHRMRWSKETLWKIFSLVDEVSPWAVRLPYQSPAEVAIRFSMAPKGVSSLLVGAKNPEQLEKNLNTLSLPPLDQEIIDLLKEKFAGRTEEFNPDRQGWAH